MISSPFDNDTIAAISTAPGRGGIAVIKISGPASLTIVNGIFASKKNPGDFHRHMIHGFIKDRNGDTIDEALAVYMPGPQSYTGDDVVEIQLHGGYAAASVCLSLVISYGARPAEPGEFTRRAFLNGRIDLVQAEAVMEIVSAESREHLIKAEKLLDGAFSHTIGSLLDTISRAAAHIERAIDFTDQDAENITRDTIIATIKDSKDIISHLIRSFRTAGTIKHGITVTIAGRVNAGKSSLFNTLLGRKRALIHERPGTTRDWISERLDFDGIPVHLVDTAGLRDTDDDVEREGILETRRIIEKTDILLYLLSPDETLPPVMTQDSAILLPIIGKADLLPLDQRNSQTLSVSTLTGEGIDNLLFILSDYSHSIAHTFSDDSTVLIERHIRHLKNAYNHLDDALESMETWSEEIVSLGLRSAEREISSILGRNIESTVLDEIFKSFCIGK